MYTLIENAYLSAWLRRLGSAVVAGALCIAPSATAAEPSGNPVGTTLEDAGGAVAEREYFADWHEPYGHLLPREVRDPMVQAVRALPDETTEGGTGAWEQIGPLTMVTPGGGRYTGRVLDIRWRPNHIWIAAASGGLWSCFGGFACSPMTDDLPSLAIGSFDFGPGNLMLVGTGEPKVRTGAGLFRSTDGGQTWTSAPMGIEPDGFYRIRFTPGTDVAHAATTSGYFRSPDGGQTWVLRYAVDTSDLALHPTDPDVVIIAGWGSGLWRSIDNGVTWQPWNNPGLPTTDLGRGAIAIAPSNPSVMYVAWGSAAHHMRGVYRTTDGGQTWADVSPPDDYLTNQAWYDNVVTVSPTDADRVFVGGVNFYTSADGGASWTQISSSHLNDLHVDYHAFEWSPTGTLYAGHDGGWSTGDASGASWSTVFNLLPITQYYNIHTSTRDGLVVLGGSQDNGISITRDAGTSWEFVIPQDGFGVSVDPNDPDRMWAVKGPPAQRHRSSTGGADGTWTSNLGTGIDPADAGGWFKEIRNDQIDPVYLYTTAGPHVYQSTNYGDQWSRLNPTPFAAVVRDVHVSRWQPGGSAVYATVDTATTGERIQVHDLGAWHARDAGLPTGREVRTTIAHPFDGDTAFAIMNGIGNPGQKVYRTTDRGATWQNVTGNLPDVPVSSVIAHPTDDQVLVAGTEMGCFRTTDGGQGWHRWNAGLPDSVIVTEMTWVDELATTGEFHVVAGTYGRSIWRREITTDDAAGDSIFSDGFESGDTSAWTSAAP